MSDKEKTALDRIPSANPGADRRHARIIEPKGQGERKYPRTDLESLNKVLEENVAYLPIKLGTAANGEFKGMILDFSESGCRIAVSVQLQKGELAKVGFIINKRTITSTAIVRWVLPHSHVYLVGMEFQGMSKDAKELLWAISEVALLDNAEIAKIRQVLR
jgi:hypothetical protein